jgi:hypothetical protein
LSAPVRSRRANDCGSPEDFSRTVRITFHCRGITSSVSVMSSPGFDSFAEPQQGTAFWRGDDDALAREMMRKRLA